MKSREGVDKVKVEGTLYEDALQQAEVMNKSFQTVFTRKKEFEMNNIIAIKCLMENIKVDVKEVKQLMESQDVRKASGPDGVSNYIMKECNDQLAGKLHSIIENSLKESRVLLDWKRANIVPIHKGRDKEKTLNYIPVSLTSVVAKTYEKIVKDRWLNFLEETNTLSSGQFGFRRGRSCITNLLSFYARVIDVTQEREGWVDCIYLELKKACDKVTHKRLL